MIGSSYQSSLSPRSTNIESLIDQQSTALTRAHSVPERTTHVLRSEAFQSSLTPRSIKNFLRSRALMRAHWLPDRQTNVSRSGALLRAYWPPINQKILAIRSSYQCSLTPWSTNKHVVIGSSFQSSLSPWSTSIESLIDQQTIWNRELLSELILRESSYHSSLTPWSIKNFLQSGALIRTRWLPDHPTNLLLLEAFIRAYSLPDWSESPCDQELVSEPSDSRIDQQPSCDREL